MVGPKKITLIIRRSQIPFVIVGPRGSNDAALVKSDNAQLDLLGFSAMGRSRRERHYSPPTTSSLVDLLVLPSLRRNMWSVEATVGPDGDREGDNRRVMYRFCWRGECNSGAISLIEEEFERRIADIQLTLKNRDVPSVEWNLAPIIYMCRGADVRRRRIRALAVVTVMFYVVAGIGVSMALWLSQRFSH